MLTVALVDGAMKRFLSSSAPSSSGRAELPSSSSSAEHPATSLHSAEQPAEQLATSLRSAEQPAMPSHLKLSSIQDVQRWLADEPMASCSSVDMQRIREVVAVLSRPKPRREDVQPLQSKWQVAQKTKKKPRSLGEILPEFQAKVIKAAHKLQLELTDSTQQPADGTSGASGSTVEQSAHTDTADGIDLDEDPVIAELRARHRKRAQSNATEEQRPLAKLKAAKRQNKRTAGTTSDSVEQPVSKKQGRCLTAELFLVCARDPNEPDILPGSAAQSAEKLRLWGRKMQRLHLELQKLTETWVVGEQLDKLKEMIWRAKEFGSIPASFLILQKRSTNQLLTLSCGNLQIRSGSRKDSYQDASFFSVAACKALEERVAQFLQQLEEITEDAYPILWELKQSQTEAVLNSLPEMANSPEQLMQNMKNDCTSLTGGKGSTPFGRCKANTQLFGFSANYSMQMLACLEMPQHSAIDVFSSLDNSDLINMVMQSRERYVEACPPGPPWHFEGTSTLPLRTLPMPHVFFLCCFQRSLC